MSGCGYLQLRCAIVAGFAGAMALAQEVAITVQLTAPPGGAAHKGDRIAAQIASPDSLKGDTILCTVTQVGNSRRQAAVKFTIDSLHHSSGVDIPVAATI